MNNVITISCILAVLAFSYSLIRAIITGKAFFSINFFDLVKGSLVDKNKQPYTFCGILGYYIFMILVFLYLLFSFTDETFDWDNTWNMVRMDENRVIIIVLILLGLIIISFGGLMGFVVNKLKKQQRQMIENPPSGEETGFQLNQLNAMKKKGLISDEEYDKLIASVNIKESNGETDKQQA